MRVHFTEEKYTYPLYREWGNIVSYLNDVLVEEVDLVDKSSVRQWHLILQNFFNKPPTNNSLLKFAGAIGVKKEATAFNAEYSRLTNNTLLVGVIKNIYPSLFEYGAIPLR